MHFMPFTDLVPICHSLFCAAVLSLAASEFWIWPYAQSLCCLLHWLNV